MPHTGTAELPLPVPTAHVQRALGHLPLFVSIFIDDVVVFTKGDNIEAHYNHVKQFLETCQEAGVYLKDSKAQMCKESLRFLGHTLSAKDCQPQHDKVAAIKDWPRLETVTQVRQYLGLAGYYRRFVHCFSEIAQPLTSLAKTGVPWEWGEQQQWAFEELNEDITFFCPGAGSSGHNEKAADGTVPFLAQTDANCVALGGVSMQDTGEGVKVIAYESRQFSAAEQNYHTGGSPAPGVAGVTWKGAQQAPSAVVHGLGGDYVVKTPRDELKEAGVVDEKTDLPKDPLSVLDVEDLFEDSPPAARPHTVTKY
ncbi:hypothetical protein CYMTET_44571 [Cymbomonas tetramitiformis]|uniref:Reverse transcriptase domain-containing protein n=1 Tax=Cymbomonas tetramitiformis TaxID=36881 RepID=A0AAE0C160_9CHLO|nr:hypothetical protein CYMTET_44571 [Cymbomonas tetramitiformis]